MTEADTQARSVYIWVAEGTWRATVDAALDLAPAGARFTLLHVTPAEVPDAVHGAPETLARTQNRVAEFRRDRGFRRRAVKAAG